MSKRNAPEFLWDEQKQVYYKRVCNQNGNWVRVTGKTKAELRKNIEERKAYYAALDQQDAEPSSPYVYEYVKKWFDINSAHVGSYRKLDLTNAINNHILPIIGDMQMQDVTSDDIGRISAALAKTSRSLQLKVIGTTKQIFHSAYRAHIIDTDPAEDIKVSAKKPKQKLALTPNQETALLKATRELPVYTIVLLGLYAGLRREEICGLKWDRVHLNADTPHIEVKRAVTWPGNNHPQVKEILKSDASERTIPIPDILVQHLRTLPHKDSDFVVSGAKPWSYSQFRSRWQAIYRRTSTNEKPIGSKSRNHKVSVSLDFHVTPHILRHTYITKLILAGVNIKTVQYLAGHATIQMTLDIYTNLISHKPEDIYQEIQVAF